MQIPLVFYLGNYAPARIPREVAGSSRTHPLLPETDAAKGLLTAEIPADPRPPRKYQDRPVTPEVAGSSPVAPVPVQAISGT